MEPIKSLFVFPISQIWGGENVWLKFLEKVDRRKISPYALVFGKGELSKRLKEIDVPCYILPSSRLRNIFSSLKNLLYMISFLKKEKFDVVNSLGVHLLTTLSTSFLNIPYILHIHTIHPLPLIDKWCVRKAKHIVTVSNFSKKFLTQYGVNPEYIKVIYNGVDVEELERKVKGTDLRKELGLDKDTKIVCYIGRIVKWKNLDFFIRAIPEIKQSFSGKVKFLFVGETPKRDKEPDYKDTLLKLAKELGVQNDIIFTGRRDDIVDILKNIDIFAIPSYLEVCSMSILEAMSFGKPVIAMRKGGNPELITESTGILVEPEDLVGFAKATVELLINEEKREKMGEASYKRARNFFHISNNVKELENVILNVCQKN
jgi:glycosyltransferase involved in cell wall biosynthesis